MVTARSLLDKILHNGITVGEIVDRWLEEYVRRECTPDYYRSCVGVNKNYLQDLASLRWDELEPKTIKECQGNKWGSAKSANRTLTVLHAALNWANGEGFISRNPIQNVKRLRVEKKAKYIPSSEDVEKCLAACRATRSTLFLFYVTTGARKQEALKLKKSDVHLDGPEPYVVLHTRKKRDRNRTPRTIPITTELRGPLEEQVAWSKSEYVFTHGNGNRLKNLSRWLTRVCEDAGVPPYQFHALRHYFAHQLWKNDAPIDWIQLLLGHESPTTTRIYLSQITVPHKAVKYINGDLGQQSG